MDPAKKLAQSDYDGMHQARYGTPSLGVVSKDQYGAPAQQDAYAAASEMDYQDASSHPDFVTATAAESTVYNKQEPLDESTTIVPVDFSKSRRSTASILSNRNTRAIELEDRVVQFPLPRATPNVQEPKPSMLYLADARSIYDAPTEVVGYQERIAQTDSIWTSQQEALVYAAPVEQQVGYVSPEVLGLGVTLIQSMYNGSTQEPAQSLDAMKTDFRRNYIATAARGTVTEMSQQFGMNRSEFSRVLGQLDIRDAVQTTNFEYIHNATPEALHALAARRYELMGSVNRMGQLKDTLTRYDPVIQQIRTEVSENMQDMSVDELERHKSLLEYRTEVLVNQAIQASNVQQAQVDMITKRVSEKGLSLPEATKEFEKQVVAHTLSQAIEQAKREGTKSVTRVREQVADLLDVDPMTVFRWEKKLKVDVKGKLRQKPTLDHATATAA